MTTPRRIGRRAVLGGALAAATLSGCARGTLTRPAPPDLVTLNNDNPTWDTGYQAASEVLRKHTGLGLSVRAVPNVSNYQQIVRMSAQTDSATDMIKWWNGYRMNDIARNGLLAELDGAWDDAEAKGWVSPGLRESFSTDGHAYGVPLYKSYFAAFYSRAAFDKIGARPPQTWDDFLDLCAELRDAGITAIGAGGASGWESLIWFEQLLGGADPDFYQAVTNNQASYTDDQAQQAMIRWARMYADGLFSPPDFDATTAPARLQEGSLGLSLMGTWQANTFGQAEVGSDDVGLFLIPPVDPELDQLAFIESGAFAVPINAHKPEDAVAVCSAWMATDVQQAWISFLGDMSANPNAIPKDSIIADLAAETTENPPRELLRYWEASPPILIEGNVLDLSGFMIEPTERTGRRTLETMQERAVAEWRAWENS